MNCTGACRAHERDDLMDMTTATAMNEGEPVNLALRDHQLMTAGDWQFHGVIAGLQRFFDIFNSEFFAPQALPPAAISLDRSSRRRLGHYVPGRNGFGLCHNINLNKAWLGRLSELARLEVLAHEQIHQWQELYGTPPETGWYHNKEFCEKAAAIGIIAQRPRGYTVGLTDPFLAVCRAHGVNDAVPDFSAGRQRLPGSGRSTLRKWVCRCAPPVNVWIGVREFDATCNRCRQRIEPAAQWE